MQRPDGRNSGQGSVHSRDTISPRPSPASGKDSRPRRIHVSPEGLLKQRAHLRLAQGRARAGFTEKQPWPDRHANRPYRRSIQCKDRLTPYPDAALLSRQGRSDRSHFAAPLTDLTGKQCRLPYPGCRATRQGEADSSQVQPRAP
jgi:hypothetical protein